MGRRVLAGLRRPAPWLVGALYAGVAVVGAQVADRGAARLDGIGTWALILALTPVGAVAVSLMAGLVLAPGRAPGAGSKPRRGAFVGRWAAIYACWMPLWLSTYPGFFAYDAAAELNYVLEGPINSHHPPLHTWVLGYGVEGLHALLGQWNYAIAVYILAQALLVAACFAWVLGRLQTWGAPRWVIWGALAYYAVFPTVALFALCSTKDVLFSTAVLTLMILLVDFAKGRSGGRFWVLLGAVSAVVLLLRVNAVYGFVPFAVVALIGSRGRRRPLAIALGAPIALTLFATEVLYPHILHYLSPQPESKLSIPIQQLARVYNRSAATTTGQERAAIEQWWSRLDCLRAYAPQNSDPTKRGIDNAEITARPGDFLRDWARIGLRHPGVYVNATLANTYQGWYPGAMITGYNYPGGPAYLYSIDGTSYFIFRAEPPGEMRQPSLLPAVQDFYLGLSKSPTVTRIPVVSWLFAPGAHLMALILVIALAAARASGGRAMLLPAVMLLCLTLTVFFGPVMLIRYFLALFFAFPLLAAFLARAGAFAAAPGAVGPAAAQAADAADAAAAA
ncbi:MAG: DUF6020 family protein, partial [Bifidobacteriaceae bacterium]|nr:DUF6020 family protein [Bifidobacteriaceae bacterium]